MYEIRDNSAFIHHNNTKIHIKRGTPAAQSREAILPASGIRGKKGINEESPRGNVPQGFLDMQ
jgi:hypothetical protein